MTTDQLFKHLEKTGEIFCVMCGENDYSCWFAGISKSYMSGKTPQKALKKLYDYAKKEGLIEDRQQKIKDYACWFHDTARRIQKRIDDNK